MVEHTVQKIGDKVTKWNALRLTLIYHKGGRLLGNIRQLGPHIWQGGAEHLQQPEHQGDGGDPLRQSLLLVDQDPAQVGGLVARGLLRPQGLQLDRKRWFWSPQRINWQRYLWKWKLQQKKFEVHQLYQHKGASHPWFIFEFPNSWKEKALKTLFRQLQNWWGRWASQG